MGKKEKEAFRRMLLEMRERLTGQIAKLRDESLRRHDWENVEEDGTDAFDRQFALELVSSENHSVNEIDEALQRIDDGVYGTCESCGGPIERPRLKALPFVRMCVGCQSELEKQRKLFRPPPSSSER